MKHTNGTPDADLPDELGSSSRSGLYDAIAGANHWREWLHSCRAPTHSFYMGVKPLWYADYLHQIEPFVKIINDVEMYSRPKYLITNHSVEMVDDGIHPEDRELIRVAKQRIETIRQRFEDQFYYDQRRNKQTTGYPYPRAEGRNSPDDPGNRPRG